MDNQNSINDYTKKIARGHLEISTLIRNELSSLIFHDHFQCYRQTPASLLYYVSENSSIWQMFDDSPDWIKDLALKVPQDFTHHEISVIKILPGNTIPLHQDKHYLLQKKHGVGETWRYLIFLEDWKSGHYFEISDQPLVDWKAGDWVKFHRSHWHLVGNMGEQPFYSAQVTVK